MTEEGISDAPSTYVKKEYTTFVVEREIDAPRDVAWNVLLGLIEKNVGGYLIEGDPAPHGLGRSLLFRFPVKNYVKKLFLLSLLGGAYMRFLVRR